MYSTEIVKYFFLENQYLHYESQCVVAKVSFNLKSDSQKSSWVILKKKHF